MYPPQEWCPFFPFPNSKINSLSSLCNLFSTVITFSQVRKPSQKQVLDDDQELAEVNTLFTLHIIRWSVWRLHLTESFKMKTLSSEYVLFPVTLWSCYQHKHADFPFLLYHFPFIIFLSFQIGGPRRLWDRHGQQGKELFPFDLW